VEAVVTPPTVALAICGLGVPSLDKSGAVSLLIGILPCTTKSHDNHDVRDTIEARCHAQAQSRTPERRVGGAAMDHFSPQAFRAAIWAAPYPRWFRPPTHISKYNGETNIDRWLEDYCLAMRAGGSDDDFTDQYLPLLLSSLTRAWLEQLEPGSIRCWGDLRSIFIGHF
jgi:hypothetical protein